MPVTAIINMRALKGGRMPRSFHCLMHPLFLDRVTNADALLGKALHDSEAMAPYSISPIMGRKVRGSVIENETYWVRICLLQSEIEDVFLETLEGGLWNEPISLEDLSFQVEDVCLGKDDANPWSDRKSYEEMMAADTQAKKIAIRMASPMSFKRGDLHYPLPEPAMIFSNLARRWNLFSPHKLDECPLCLNVSYSNIDIHTEPYALRKGGTVLGAVGTLTFIFKGRDAGIRDYQTLLDFAFFSGIGVKTTQGMGMCRII